MPNGFVMAVQPPGEALDRHDGPPVRPGRSRTLMGDIAQMAGVSISTVSRALRGGGTVAAHTRARIQAIAQAVHYGVDVRASGLRLGLNPDVSVVVPRPAGLREPWRDPMVMELLGCIAESLARHGQRMLLSLPAQLSPTALAQDVLTGRACGLIVLGQGDEGLALAALAQCAVPCVAWEVQPQPAGPAVVGTDLLVAGRLATGHLLDRGARQVAFLADVRPQGVSELHAGYLQAHRARGVRPLAEQPLPIAPTAADPLAQVDDWLHRTPSLDGLLAGHDLLAIGAIDRLHRLGRRVPQDILVAGCGGTALAAHSDPPVTTVGPTMAEVGAALVQALQDRLTGGRAHDPLLLTSRLQVRQSSAAWRRAPRQPALARG